MKSSKKGERYNSIKSVLITKLVLIRSHLHLAGEFLKEVFVTFVPGSH